MQSVDMNGGHINGTINNDKKENSKVMSLMYYHYAIAKSGIAKQIL